jgi:hypothetical protein
MEGAEPAARAAAAAAAAAVAVAAEEDLEMVRWWWVEDDECRWAPAEARPEVEGLRDGGLVPGTTGFFRGGAIVDDSLPWQRERGWFVVDGEDVDEAQSAPEAAKKQTADSRNGRARSRSTYRNGTRPPATGQPRLFPSS